MAIERTLSIIKPDATRRNLTGAINDRFERQGLRIVAQKRLRLSQDTAERFYAVHAQRPFYRSLVDFMISGPVVAQVLEGENAVIKNRDVMGATDPAKAAAGTIRKDFAESIEANSVHGSDSPENAAQEIAFFFAETEICPCCGAAAGNGGRRDRLRARSPVGTPSRPRPNRRSAPAVRPAPPNMVDIRRAAHPRPLPRAERDRPQGPPPRRPRSRG
jgi:nucleoside-diphosphate kinase